MPANRWHNLEGNGVVLEMLRKRHAPALFRLIEANRAHLRTWLPWVDSHTSIENTRSLVEAGEMQQALDNGCLWVIQDESRQLVGIVDLQWIQWQHRAASLGYWLGAQFQGKGLMTRALEQVQAFVFEELELNRLEIGVACDNLRSLFVAERLGFQIEGRRRQYECIDGRYLDHYSLAMLASDYRLRLPS